MPRQEQTDRSHRRAVRRSINQSVIDPTSHAERRPQQDQRPDCLQSECGRPSISGRCCRTGPLHGWPGLPPSLHHCLPTVHQNVHASSNNFRSSRIQRISSQPFSSLHSYVLCSILNSGRHLSWMFLHEHAVNRQKYCLLCSLVAMLG